MTYDREADAAYIRLAHGKIDGTEEFGPFLYDVDADGKVLGIEILSCTKVLAAGEWTEKARLLQHRSADAAE